MRLEYIVALVAIVIVTLREFYIRRKLASLKRAISAKNIELIHERIKNVHEKTKQAGHDYHNTPRQWRPVESGKPDPH